jgi:hypothetical protein
VTSKPASGEAGYNRSLIRQIEFLVRTLGRLSYRFAIEKEDAVEEGTVQALERLVERSRTFFQPEAMALLGSLNRTRFRTREGEGAEEVEAASMETEQMIRKEYAVFVSTPHRLLRSFGSVHGTGTDSGGEGQV